VRALGRLEHRVRGARQQPAGGVLRQRPLDRLEQPRLDRGQRRLGRRDGDVPGVGPTTSTEPARYFVLVRSLRGTASSAVAGTSACSCSECTSPIGATCTEPAWKRPGATASPTFAAPNVTVAVARIAAPGTSPVEASTPEGTSTETTGFPLALISSIIRAASSRGSLRRPIPSSASTITSGSPGSP
jgi:hypothetical protein